MNLNQLNDLIETEQVALEVSTYCQRGNPTFIPIHLTGGIGDVVMSIEGLRKLHSKFKIVIYTHHIEAFQYFCDEIPSYRDLPLYTWHLEYNTICKFHINQGFSGFLIKEHENLLLNQELVFKVYPQIQALIYEKSKKFFLIAEYGKRLEANRRSFPMVTLGYGEACEVIPSPRKKPEKYITIHDGFDVNQVSIVSGRATKTWNIDQWRQLVHLIKEELPEYEVIQLGSVTSRVIQEVDKCLVNRTTLIQSFEILSESSLHIDGDSGLVHAATRMGIPCVVMWGPTPKDFYGYIQNHNIDSPICRPCYGVKDNWNDRCPRGFIEPLCMDEIKAVAVMDKVRKALG